MNALRRLHALAALVFCSATAVQAKTLLLGFSEDEFLGEIPIVYASSRLPQHPRDAAGAVSVMDRQFIRASGARTLAELFRLVPGFQVGLSSGGRSVVAYHGLSGQASQRMQVYVDGRSVYAPYLFGGVDWSTLNVPLDEIERIEIHRGANSVAYGANAFLGVIQIHTRAAAQSVGFRSQVVQGEGGIADRHVRWGQGHNGLQWRLAAGRHADDGLLGRADAYRSEYADFRSEYQVSPSQQISLSGGLTRNRLGIGYEGRVADPARTEDVSSAFLQLRHRQTVDVGNEWQVGLSITSDRGEDSFDVPLLDGRALVIDGKRRSGRLSLEYQHFKDFGPRLRGSWGAEYRRDRLESQQHFNTRKAQLNDAWRVHAGSEWRPSAEWTLNLGGLLERDRLAPMQFAGRVALNWKPDQHNTFKLGYSSAFRMPSLLEQKADWRIGDGGRVIDVRYLSSGKLKPEHIRSVDLVYSGAWEGVGLALDARLFREEMERLITGELYRVPVLAGLPQGTVAYDLRNNASARNIGFEYELKWRPQPRTLVVWSQYIADPELSRNVPLVDAIPKKSRSLLLSHEFDNDWRASGSYSELAPMRWLGEATPAGKQRLLTLSLARAFVLGGSKTVITAALSRPIGVFDEFRELQHQPERAWLSVEIEY